MVVVVVEVVVVYPLQRLLLLRGERRETELRARPLSILHLHGFSTLEGKQGTSR